MLFAEKFVGQWPALYAIDLLKRVLLMSFDGFKRLTEVGTRKELEEVAVVRCSESQIAKTIVKARL